jgi:DNA-binding GntR family transcriptional regulator
MIQTGKLKRGERLIQETLALRFDVSRVSVKSAFLQLKKDGLITGRKGGGMVLK